jgi:metallo-beta-lactamase family protein
VASVDAFSGHADRRELSEYVKHLSGDIKRITVIHGEEDQSIAFADTLRTLKPGADVIVPQLGQVVEF